MMDWLSGLMGEKTAHIISFIGLFVFFLVVIFGIVTLIKRMTSGTYVSKKSDAAPRLSVTDATAVDSQRRLVLVRRDDVEHLILIGGPTDIVIEQNISRHKASQSAASKPQPAMAAAVDARLSSPAEIAPSITALAPAPQAVVAPTMNDAVFTAPAVEFASVAPAVMPEPVAAPVQAPVEQPAQAQQLQTHAQQMAAARQQQAAAKPQPRPQPRADEPSAPKLHPVYPLGKVSRGVIAATSGLAAANNAAQQELIEAAKRDKRIYGVSLDNVRPGSAPSGTEAAPLKMQRATPQVTRPAQQEPSFTSAPAAPVQADIELDLENAVAQAFSTDNDMSFEDLLATEMDQHFSRDAASDTQGTPAPAPSGTLNVTPRK